MANGKGGMANGKASGIAKGEKSQVGRMQYFVQYALHCLASTRTSFLG